MRIDQWDKRRQGGDRRAGQRPGRWLLACLLLGAAGLPMACAPASSAGEATTVSDTPEEVEIVAFLESYFASWSDGDMAAYRDHFHPLATITLLDGGEVRFVMERDPFVQMQANLIDNAPAPMTESMTGYRIEADGTAAVATVEWLLDDGFGETAGVDRFLLSRDSAGQWAILSLAFYTTGTVAKGGESP